jgi:3-phenylpropionate/trans-cinnamate dioxygenase ferredoxin reductase component
MNKVNSVVIVGGGVAGANAAFELRKLGFDGSVALLTDEEHLPYKRPPMSKEYLRGEQPIEKTYVKPAEQYAEQNIQLIQGSRAESIDPTSRTVTLGADTTLPYDALVLATGSYARRLEIPGADLAGIHYLRNVEDADGIRAAAMRADSIAVIGGGWLGTEVAASLRQLGRNVTLVAPPPQPLERILGAEVAGVYRRLHEENGTRLVIGRVARLEGDGTVEAVSLVDGTRIAADMVVAGVGAEPRIAMARDAGLTLRDGGVEVDAYLQTSAPGVFAAGDITTAWHPRFERYVRIEHWDNAKQQGRYVAANVLGERREYDRTPYFYSDQFDLGMEYRGLAQGWDDVVIRGSLETREFDAFWLKERRVVAAMNANRWDDAAELQDLVDRRAPADTDELAKDTAAAVVSG